MAFEPKEFGLEIIESLPSGPNDKPTGQLLFDQLIKYKTFEEPNLARTLYSVNTKSEFLKVLDNIYQKVKDSFFFPILHIEAHGFENGLELASRERVLWSEMMPILREINVTIENNLVIMMAACQGAMIGFRPEPSKRAPFRVIIGSLRDVIQEDLLTGFEAFYATYFFSLDPGKSVDAMNAAVQKPYTFGVITSEKFFDDMLNPDRDPIFFKKMVEERAMDEKLSRSDYASISLETIRFKWDCKIRELFKEERKNRDYFTMKDLKGK